MASLNKIMLMGNLTKDPEFRFSQSGTAICSFNIAVNDPVKKDAEALFIRIVVFNRQAEACRDYLKKGSHVFVEGRLQIAKWETDAGQRGSRPEVIANFIQFLSSGKKTESDKAWDNPLGEDEKSAMQKVDDLTDDDCDELPF